MSTGAPEITATRAALRLVNLEPLMEVSRGSAEIGVGLLDGPLAIDHPELLDAHIRAVGASTSACSRLGSSACIHGTFVAGILVGGRGEAAPGICPDCTLLVRPIFAETDADGMPPLAPPTDVAHAIVECVDSGARIVNLSAATAQPTTCAETGLRRALDHATRRGALIVAAAGNQSALAGSEITQHPGVLPVAAYDLRGRPMPQSNFGRSVGGRGLGAPGEGIESLATEGVPTPRAGTSFAAAFVTGAAALLWSLFPSADAATIKWSLTAGVRRTSVIPPLMNAARAHALLTA